MAGGGADTEPACAARAKQRGPGCVNPCSPMSSLGQPRGRRRTRGARGGLAAPEPTPEAPASPSRRAVPEWPGEWGPPSLAPLPALRKRGEECTASLIQRGVHSRGRSQDYPCALSARLGKTPQWRDAKQRPLGSSPVPQCYPNSPCAQRNLPPQPCSQSSQSSHPPQCPPCPTLPTVTVPTDPTDPESLEAKLAVLALIRQRSAASCHRFIHEVNALNLGAHPGQSPRGSTHRGFPPAGAPCSRGRDWGGGCKGRERGGGEAGGAAGAAGAEGSGLAGGGGTALCSSAPGTVA